MLSKSINFFVTLIQYNDATVWNFLPILIQILFSFCYTFQMLFTPFVIPCLILSLINRIYNSKHKKNLEGKSYHKINVKLGLSIIYLLIIPNIRYDLIKTFSHNHIFYYLCASCVTDLFKNIFEIDVNTKRAKIR